MNERIWRWVSTLSLLALLFAQSFAFAQAPANYPNRPVRVVIPFPPGAASDFTARIIQPVLTADLGRQIVVDNRGGVGGLIAAELVANSNPDGHTLLHGNVGAIAINPWLHRSVQPLRDLIPITLLVDVPSVLVTRLSLPTNSLKEFIDYVKSNPGKINWSSGSSSPSIGSRLQMESFMRVVGIKMVYVGYQGGAAAAAIGLMSNEVQVMFVALPSVIGFVKQNRLRGLAVTAGNRISALPDVPTMAELGHPAMKFGSWQGLFAPKGTAPAIVQRLFTALVKIMDLPEVKTRLVVGGVYSVASKSPAEFFEFVKAETNQFGKALKDLGADATAGK